VYLNDLKKGTTAVQKHLVSEKEAGLKLASWLFE